MRAGFHVFAHSVRVEDPILTGQALAAGYVGPPQGGLVLESSAVGCKRVAGPTQTAGTVPVHPAEFAHVGNLVARGEILGSTWRIPRAGQNTARGLRGAILDCDRPYDRLCPRTAVGTDAGHECQWRESMTHALYGAPGFPGSQIPPGRDILPTALLFCRQEASP